ncbi:hypothetical protein [Spiroplasma clarkii]|uniref:hypothetical protein n=1 Tax=Spiroplasma clarkii TaxID=2139 RepID=UPI0011BA9C92|nr:hypothetical protein [Spiroplasma clarkii]
MEKKKNKLFDYTPNNPNDSKRPTLKDESTKSVEVEQEAQTVTLIAKPMLKAQELISDSVDKEAKSSAQSLIARLKAQVSEKTEQPSTNNVANPFVSVDPDAENYEKKTMWWCQIPIVKFVYLIVTKHIKVKVMSMNIEMLRVKCCVYKKMWELL